MDNITIIKQVDDHEERLRDIEKEKVETKMKLVGIERDIAVQGKQISDLQLNVKIDFGKLDEKLDMFMFKVLDKQDETQKTVNLLVKHMINKDELEQKKIRTSELQDKKLKNDIKKINISNIWDVGKKIIPWLITGISTVWLYITTRG